MQPLDHPVGWYVDGNVGEIENNECNIELVSSQLKIFGEAVDLCVSNVASIDEGQQPLISISVRQGFFLRN